MGTRGLAGFRLNSTDYLQYSHNDSYPNALGKQFSSRLSKFQAGDLRALVENVRVIDQDVVEKEPSPEDWEKYKQFADESLNRKSWYVLLRNLQHDPITSIEAGVILLYNSFINDSLFCEWAYIANLDTEKLEIYKGFQTEIHTSGRYGTEVPNNMSYYPCALIKEIPFSDLENFNWNSVEHE